MIDVLSSCFHVFSALFYYLDIADGLRAIDEAIRFLGMGCGHPIKTFYNLGLTKNEQELMECPQINVSINTDDKGVFATKLENEYALLAYAMEHEALSDGKKRYRKEFIYEWLDNIREMGIRQIFG